ncbi:hypothetical protein GUITHDRAFT_153603 [Guillardia theta CCMP2712]|uniref:Uncharacterized protein n=1 Tax=Guillardia theta (strain CCMP2712) TaxID=905079 RepID=L1J2M6_GUITC|nr:hypothetical protein GUITHDRAFT_153603 [Guillardia theta CCMP2712]EKX42389.1 hypothetical protein GUITHDRAFT_153603 [Guillardia theta CCMP2712]|eukprot:XP_005829369.1 hypothetical protein GUITHDRAFT_153603 [Guillardia theta CCMP2712]
MPANSAASNSQDQAKFSMRRTWAVVLSVSAMVVLAVALQSKGAGSGLLQQSLSQNLMSQFSRDSGDATQSLSSSNWYGHWGSHDNLFKQSHEKNAANKWTTQLQKMEAAQEERRKREDKEFFAGVEKAFGKKTAAGMMAAFNGKTRNGLAHIKLNEHKLNQRKQKIVENNQLPNVAQKVQAHKKVVEKAEEAKPEAHAQHNSAAVKDALKVAKKMADHTASSHVKVTPAKTVKPESSSANEDVKSSAVKEALKVAKKMAEHKDPVAKTSAPKEEVKKAKKEDLKHPGLIADTQKIKELVHEFKHAHGAKKKEIKARVMSLQQSITSDFAKVTAFGHNAQTEFAREEAKEHGQKKANSGHHFSWH